MGKVEMMLQDIFDRRCKSCHFCDVQEMQDDDTHYICNKEVSHSVMVTPDTWCEEWEL